MEAVGIKNQNEDDPLLLYCVELFLKSSFNFENSKEWYQKRYRAVRDNLANMQKYQEKGGGNV